MNIRRLLKAEGDENKGHGHVFTRPDSTVARCGGPGMCNECRKDFDLLQTFLRDDVSAAGEKS